jgi:hypothetical protein
VVGPYVAGGVIGDHVETVARLGRGRRRGGLELVVAGSSSASEDRWPFVGMLFISLLISVTTARYRWRLRPKALSGSPSR